MLWIGGREKGGGERGFTRRRGGAEGERRKDGVGFGVEDF